MFHNLLGLVLSIRGALEASQEYVRLFSPTLSLIAIADMLPDIWLTRWLANQL